VFYEIQRKNLRAVPLGPAATNATDGLRITVHRTRTSGPVRVAVSRNGSDGFEPVDAPVRFGGTLVGTTGSDGVLWTVAPRGAMTATAGYEGRNVTVAWFSVPSVESNAVDAVALPAATTPPITGERLASASALRSTPS
jgi:hypothetical protein